MKTKKRKIFDIKWIISGFMVPIFIATSAYYIKKYNTTTHVQLLEPGYDFILKASEAKWTNGSITLPYPGARNDKDGFVYFR